MTINDCKNIINKIMLFYFPDQAGYWNGITECNITQPPKSLGKYYLDFSSKFNYPGIFSTDGIPLYSYFGKRHIQHPIVIAQYGLGVFENLCSHNGDNIYLEKKYISIADWFINNAVRNSGSAYWFINHRIPEYGLNQPWISALSQGEAISILTRAAKISSKELYIEIATEAMHPFEVDVKEGGLLNHFKSIPVYEEYPSKIRTVAVLNGFLFSLFGLFDLVLYNNNSEALHLFEKGCQSIRSLLPFYDLSYWTRYYLFDYPNAYASSYTYHILVAEQLKSLFFLTNEKVFLDYSNKWIKYSRNYLNRTRALIKKLVYANTLYS